MVFHGSLRAAAGLLSVLLLSVLLLTGPALAIGVGFLVEYEVTGDGSTGGPVAVPVTLSGKVGEVSGVHLSSPGEWDITINAELDPDPQIIYAVSVIDFGAPSSFGFTFLQGIVPTPAPGIVSHSHSSSTTDATGSTPGTAVTALSPPAGLMQDTDGVTPDEIAVFNVSVNGGATYLSAGLDLNPSFTGASPSDTQGPFNPAAIPGPAGAGFYDVMRVDANFSMTGGSDAFTFNGTANVVPEPGTFALLLAGLAGLSRVRKALR